MTLGNTDNNRYHKYANELQPLYLERITLLIAPEVTDEEVELIEKQIWEKIIEALLDWDLGRSDLHALGRLINLCENRECPPDPVPDIQYLL